MLVGDPEHPEMKSVISRAGKNGVCVRDASEVEPLLSALRGCRVAVLAQTTARESEVEKVLDKLRKAGISVQSENTICTVTHERQEAIAELARGCQVVLWSEEDKRQHRQLSECRRMRGSGISRGVF